MFSSTFPPPSPFPPSDSPSLPPSLPPSFPSPYLPQSPRWSGPRRSSRRRQRCGCCACTSSPDSSTWRCSAVGEERRKGAKEGEGRSVSTRDTKRENGGGQKPIKHQSRRHPALLLLSTHFSTPPCSLPSFPSLVPPSSSLSSFLFLLLHPYLGVEEARQIHDGGLAGTIKHVVADLVRPVLDVQGPARQRLGGGHHLRVGGGREGGREG